MTELVEVPQALAEERLDRVLATVFDLARNEAARLIKDGKVHVGGVAVDLRSRRMHAGERLEVDLSTKASDQPRLRPTEIGFEVVYDDDDVIVVDKPAGLVVHPGAGHVDDTLVAALFHRYPELAVSAGLGEPTRPGIVHRLDKDTSGLLVIARSARAYDSLRAQLLARSARRTYLALVRGTVAADEGRIEAPIGRSIRNRTMMAVRSGGREATTHYVVLERISAERAVSFLEVRLDTGRTHQIRVHLAAIGHPIAGDGRYGGKTITPFLSRPFLHAAALSFEHPGSGTEMSFEAPLPEELTAVLDALRAEASYS